MITIDDFEKIDMRIGTVLECILNDKAKKPAYKITIDFGDLGIKTSSAQLTELYNEQDLIGKQIIAVVNFPSRQVATVLSEVLILGTDSEQGIVLLKPSEKVKNGDRIF
jgi:export-related chaperone CsaA